MKMKTMRAAAAGLGAGAAGTTALNAVTYLDMAVRGRPSSSTPQASVEKLADKGGVDIPGDPGTRQWTLTDWLSDVVPHLAYGLVTAAVLDGLHRD